MLINEVNGEAHDVEVGAGHAGTSDVTNPFLHAVGAGFVEGTVFGDIMIDLGVGKVGEGDVGAID